MADLNTLVELKTCDFDKLCLTVIDDGAKISNALMREIYDHP